MWTFHKYLTLKKLSVHYIPPSSKVMLKESDWEIFLVQRPPSAPPHSHPRLPPNEPQQKPAAQLMEPLTAFAHRRENDASNSPRPPWKSTAVERALPEGRSTGWAPTSISQKLSLCICMCFPLHALVHRYKIRRFFKFSFLIESPAPMYQRCTPRGGLHLYVRPIYSVYLYSG